MKSNTESKTFYRIIYRKKTDPETWHIKCNCPEKWQAEKFIDNLLQCSNLYLELKIVPVSKNDIEQWVADVYHCSDIWGQKMTEDDMFALLTEHEKEKDPEDYSPSPYLFKECCEYWNQLCDMYPN